MNLQRINISIIVPVYQESENINSFLTNLKLHDAEHLKEIIVVDSIGDTIAAVDTPLINWNKLKLLKSKVKGRALQMNYGARTSKGEILLFLHADSKLPRNALFNVIDLMRDENISAGAFNLCFDDNNIWFKLIGKVASIRSRFTRLPYGDQGIFVRCQVFDKFSGFIPMSLFEDVDFCQRLKINKYKLSFTNSSVVTSSRRYQRCFICTVLLNLIITTLYYIGVDVEKLAKLYN